MSSNSKQNAAPHDPTEGLRLGLYGGPGGGAFPYERGSHEHGYLEYKKTYPTLCASLHAFLEPLVRYFSHSSIS
jgi:hypothetical protein